MAADSHTDSDAQASAPRRDRRHFILGTAGHIDHGKTTLIKALTGTDTDRLPEEKQRGMTIELGFAELKADDVTFGIVDVPGHEKFVRTMVAGATGVDVALIVVAADDSVMPQTVEHVEIMDLLGVRHGVVALTKCDLADTELTDLVEGEIAELLAGTALKSAPIVRVSAVKRTGLDQLTRRLVEAAGKVARAEFDQPFRMHVDRVFTVAGRGTVVTGSVVSGRLHRGDSVDIWPVGARGRIREVQSHGAAAEWVEAGQRAAVNLQGVNRDTIARGCELAAVGSVEPVRLLDARLSCLKSHRQPIRNYSRLRLCLGTREVLARCVSLSGGALEPGETAYVQLRCAEPVTAMYGQRFIVRDENATRTAGGGLVLRAAQRRLSVRMADEIAGLRTLHEGEVLDRVAEVVRGKRFEPLDEGRVALAAGVSRAAVSTCLQRLTDSERVVTLEGIDRPVSVAFLEAFQRRTLGWLKSYHQQHPDEPGCLSETLAGWLERKSNAKGLGKVLLTRLIDSGEVKVMGRYVCLKEFAPSLSAQDEKVLARMLEAVNEAGFQPPSVGELATLTHSNRSRIEKLLKVACSLGQLVKVDGAIYLHAERDRELRDKVRALFDAQGPFTMSELRETLGSSRKYVVPIGEYLDRVGVTRRLGDKREVLSAEES